MGLSALQDYQINILSSLYIAFLTFSLAGSFSVLLVSIVKWRHLKDQALLLVQLTLADLLAALVLMFTSVKNKAGTSTGLMCHYSLPLSLTFYFISFLLVIVYAWKSKNVIQGWRESATDDEDRQSQCRKKIIEAPLYAIVWLIPLVLYFGYLLFFWGETTSLVPLQNTQYLFPLSNITMNIPNQTHFRCILFLNLWSHFSSDDILERYHDYFIGCVLLIVLISVIISCSFIYYKVEKWYEKRMDVGLFPVEGDGLSRRRFKRVLSTTRNMVLVVLFCWIPVLLVILVSIPQISSKVKQQDLFPLYCFQAVMVSLQGFLNSMVYAWKRPNFTDAVLGENTPLLRYNQIAFFDESLRS
ncbi:uncharacterized protein si:dkey-30c15.2 [Austrofundulus limnaeus]|uniref:Uncharacterized protein si:dkey-30c15.2 n=1 Tax=Austrofundulus limnaeus TaxID=52670 RepID=A0A2I4BJ76_AUSLI|nr:PREDICTED: uncharacterized protein LOC106520318 [Austrofundulus limnaeus]